MEKKTALKKTNITRNIIIAVIAVIVIWNIFCGSIFLVINAITKNSNSYKTAIAYIENNDEIIDIVGEITRYGFFAMWSTNGFVEWGDGEGNWRHEIKVIGSEETLTVEVFLEKEAGEPWVVTDCNF